MLDMKLSLGSFLSAQLQLGLSLWAASQLKVAAKASH